MIEHSTQPTRTKRGGLNLNWQQLHSPPTQERHSAIAAVLEASQAKREQKVVGEVAITHSQTDELTSVKNRTWLKLFEKQQFDTERDHHHLALIVIDLDDFKSINDAKGHGAGDAILRATADFFRKHFRNADEVVQLDEVVRVGGDEFLIICRNQTSDADFIDNLTAKMLKLQANDEKPSQFSFGIALFDRELDQTLADTANRADQHMYRDKFERKPPIWRGWQKIWQKARSLLTGKKALISIFLV